MAEESDFIIRDVRTAEPKLEPAPADEDIEELLANSKLLGRILTLEQQVATCRENQPLVHQIFDTCQRLELRLKKVTARLNKMDKIASGTSGSKLRKVKLRKEIAPSSRNGQPSKVGRSYSNNVSDNLSNSASGDRLSADSRDPLPNWATSVESPGDSNHVQIGSSCHISDDSDGSQLWTTCPAELPAQLQELQPPGQSNGEHSGAALIYENLNSTAEDGSDNSQKSGSAEKKQRKQRSPVFILDHIKILSGDPQMYQCSVCTKKFKTKAHIRYHEFCQNGEKPYRCEECGQRFIAKSHYEYHLRTHTGERPYICPKCGKGFNQRGKVTQHIRAHTGEKPFHCETCGRGFANAQAMRRHYLLHTGERPFACEHCSKRFTGMTNLKKHIITHTGERPFMCAHCGKSFGLKWTLELHMRTHSGERPFACDQCSRAFSNSKDLKRHSAIHSGERPFKCSLCTSAFCRKDHLIRHIQNQHKKPKEVAIQRANQAAAKYLAAATKKHANSVRLSTPTRLTTTSSGYQSRANVKKPEEAAPEQPGSTHLEGNSDASSKVVTIESRRRGRATRSNSEAL